MGDNGACEGFLRSHTFSTFSESAVTDLRSALPALFQRLVPGPLRPPEASPAAALLGCQGADVFLSALLKAGRTFQLRIKTSAREIRLR